MLARPIGGRQTIILRCQAVTKRNFKKETGEMIDVRAILDLHETAVADWHKREIDNPYEGFLHVVCLQHEQNIRLWHEEDIARSPDVTDADMARVKRAIDKLNQRRNDLIEQLDDCLLAELSDTGVPAWSGAQLNTETPGSAIDRLSILALRLYHMEEQAARKDADVAHVAKVKARLAVLRQQRFDLSASLAELLADIFAGRKRLKVYHQFKMYNDPTLNPYLYKAKRPAA
jgi:cell division protein FtsB